MNTTTNRKVRGGFYWDKAEWEMTVVPAEGGTLAGEAKRFVRVPALALLLLGPVMGALFVVFLPAIGIWLLGKNLYHVAGEVAARAFHLGLGPKAVTAKGPDAAIRAGKFPTANDDADEL